jgi:hypothetical protein
MTENDPLPLVFCFEIQHLQSEIQRSVAAGKAFGCSVKVGELCFGG